MALDGFQYALDLSIKLTANIKFENIFLCFIPVEDVIGRGLANTSQTKMKDDGINLVDMKGRGMR